jgi:hypothetical protein
MTRPGQDRDRDRDWWLPSWPEPIRCLLTGDMGIANTTTSAALIAAFTGRKRLM